MKNRRPYIPGEFPPAEIEWKRIIPLIGKANAAIARFDGMLQSLINPDVLLSPLVTREAVLSSRIEGTQATLEEVMQEEGGFADKKISSSLKEDIKEIINYRNALTFAEGELDRRPMTLGLIKDIHRILLNSVRGKDKSPGEFRNSQNWIGTLGRPMEEARFVPPDPIILPEHLERLKDFLHLDDFPDKLVQLAIIHAQFEILHPFKDGNGRVGRLIIPLFLFWKRLLVKPSFYMSEYLERNRQQYDDGLLFITEKSDWQGWIEFFLNAIIEQSETNIGKSRRMLELYEESKNEFRAATQSQYAIPALDVFFKKPIINTPLFIKMVTFSRRSTANEILKKLIDAKLIKLHKPAEGRKSAVYIFCDLLNIVEDRKIC
jgi:Fic family protein